LFDARHYRERDALLLRAAWSPWTIGRAPLDCGHGGSIDTDQAQAEKKATLAGVNVGVDPVSVDLMALL
jgi:hypothetical protein